MLYSSINYSQLTRSDEILNQLSGIYDFLNKGNWEIHGRFDITSNSLSRSGCSYIEAEVTRHLRTYLTLDSHNLLPKEVSYIFSRKKIATTFKIYYQEVIPMPDLISQTVGWRQVYSVLYYGLNGHLYNTSLELKINLARALALIEY